MCSLQLSHNIFIAIYTILVASYIQSSTVKNDVASYKAIIMQLCTNYLNHFHECVLKYSTRRVLRDKYST